MPKVKGIPVELGGQEYIVPPLPLGFVEDNQDELSAFTGDLSPASIKIIIDAACASLRRNYPELTREEVANLIDVGNMMEVFEAIMDVSGLKRLQLEGDQAGEAKGPSA